MKKFISILFIASLSFAFCAAPAVYSACAACHGEDGKSIAPGSPTRAKIAEFSKQRIIDDLKKYRSTNAGGTASIMYAQSKNLSDEDIEAIANWLVTQK